MTLTDVMMNLIISLMDIVGLWTMNRLFNLTPSRRQLLFAGGLSFSWGIVATSVFHYFLGMTGLRMLISPLIPTLIIKLSFRTRSTLALAMGLLYISIVTAGSPVAMLVLERLNVDFLKTYGDFWSGLLGFMLEQSVLIAAILITWRFRPVLFDASDLYGKTVVTSLSRRLRQENRQRHLWLLIGLLTQTHLMATYVLLQLGAQVMPTLRDAYTPALERTLWVLAALLIPGCLVLVREVARSARLADRLEEAERVAAVGRLTGKVVHDIKGLLLVQRSFLQPLIRADGLAEDEAGEVRERVSRALGVAEDIERFVRNLLVVSGPEPEVGERVDLSALVRETGNALASSFSEQGISFVREIGDGLVVTGTPVRLQAAVLNLLVNALEHTPAGGRVVLRAQEDRQRRILVIEVENTGAALPPEMTERVFEPFYTTKEKGHGLGLAIVRQVAESHGGRAEAESGDGWVRFSVWLPIAGGEGRDVSWAPGRVDSVPGVS